MTYPGEVEPGNVALFTLPGSLPSPCHELAEASATLDDDRIRLRASWRRDRGRDRACPGVLEPFETQVGLEVPAGWDNLAVTVADSVWDRVAVLPSAPGFRKGAGELGLVGPVESGSTCYRGLTAASSRVALLTEPLDLASPFVVGRFLEEMPEACAGADLEDVVGTLDVETAY